VASTVILLLVLFAGILQWRGQGAADGGFTTFWLSMSVLNGLIIGFYFSIRFYRQWLPVACRAELIFASLGYANPSRVDLQRDHKRYCKAHGIKWPYLTDGPWIYHYPESSRSLERSAKR
jgi:hypothetical protein